MSHEGCGKVAAADARVPREEWRIPESEIRVRISPKEIALHRAEVCIGNYRDSSKNCIHILQFA